MQSDLSQDLTPSSSAAALTSGAVQGSRITDQSATGQQQHAKRPLKISNQVCRFYGTKKGCRAQDSCPYRHDQNSDGQSPTEKAVQHDSKSVTEDALTVTSSPVIPTEPPKSTSRMPQHRAPVPKPIPSLQQRNPREFQINQVVRRFTPVREESSDNTVLRLKLQPSDPDFPFELNALQCTLTVPIAYPGNVKPSIKIENTEIPRGFQINIERGFESLSSSVPNKTLLQLLNDLDRNLERFLTTEKAQTIKIVANRRKQELPAPIPQKAADVSTPTHVGAGVVALTSPTWTLQQKADANAKRNAEIRQLEARMSRVPLFSSLQDGISFKVPLQIPKPSRLPLPLQALKESILIVPKLYDLEPCRIMLKGVYGVEVENVEAAFEKRAVDHHDLTLMAHINYLTQNIHTMVASQTVVPLTVPQAVNFSNDEDTPAFEQIQRVSEDNRAGIVDEDRPHLIFISRPPPEWTRALNNEDNSDSETSDEFDSEDNDSDVSDGAQSQAGGASLPLSAPSAMLEKGILLSFPHMELYSIELLELREISLSVKCDRCKDTLDIKNIKPAEPASNLIRSESCNKCASSMSVSYRSEPMHINSIKAGYLDLEGCTVVDMLPSSFLPTCAECSTTQPPPGVISVRGESPIAICRECHHRLTFKIPEVKFLRVASNDARLNLPLKSKRKKENLGITAGSELPNRGRCKHYSKSYRWFRFSCCNRVYPCDRCHDEKEEHPNEHANRMICGWCSREQNYRPEDCHACRRSVIRKTGGGFWEGGKGTRDKARMSRKDPRKFKRIGGGAK